MRETAIGKALANGIRGLLKIPPQPDPPSGAEGTVQIFRAARGFYRYRLLTWGLRQASVVAGFFAFLALLSLSRDWPFSRLFSALEALGIGFFVLQLPFSFLLIALDFKYRWYMVTDRSLRIREGLFKIQERTMTFSNIQNVAIRQGPLQRFFGISDLEVRTAGGGESFGGDDDQSKADNLHIGYFRGVANADELRDAILMHLRRLRTSGLGDPEDIKELKVDAAERPESNVLAAAREVLAETRNLKEQWTRA